MLKYFLTGFLAVTAFSLPGKAATPAFDGFHQTALVQGRDGQFYGTSSNGGAKLKGYVFRMDPTGAVTVLASFNGANGDTPQAALIQAKDGNFYGTTRLGGPNDDGTIFKVSPTGVLTRLTSFNGKNGKNGVNGHGPNGNGKNGAH